MKKKNIKKTFNKKTSFAFLLGIAVSFSPLLVMGSCNITTSQGNQNKKPSENQDALSKEIEKLTYTALNDEDFKNVIISDSILNEGVAEQLGFVIPETLKMYVNKTDEKAAQYIVKVSKAKGSLEVTYKYQKAGEEKEKTQKVTIVPYQDNDLSTILEKLKGYNSSAVGEKDWKNMSASGFDASINGDNEANGLQIKKLTDYAKTLKNNKNIKAYIRKVKNEDTIKYVVVKTLEHGQKIIVIGKPVKVSPTSAVLIAIRNKLKVFDISGIAPLNTPLTSPKSKKLAYARTVIIPEDANNKFDWNAIKTTAPDASKLPVESELQDPAATTKGKIEVEKVKGEDTIHWYITYIDKNNNPLTDEYITRIQVAYPTLEEVEKYDWENAAVLKHGDAPSNLILATKDVITRIEKRDENNAPAYAYFRTYTRHWIGQVGFRKYCGLKIGAPGLFWVASNAETKYFDDIRVLFSANLTPKYEEFIDDQTVNFVPKEIRYMEVQ